MSDNRLTRILRVLDGDTSWILMPIHPTPLHLAEALPTVPQRDPVLFPFEPGVFVEELLEQDAEVAPRIDSPAAYAGVALRQSKRRTSAGCTVSCVKEENLPEGN